jgi:hypothetical protein
MRRGSQRPWPALPFGDIEQDLAALNEARIH